MADQKEPTDAPPEEPDSGIKRAMVSFVHKPSQKTWEVNLGTVIACSPVFERMFYGGSFSENQTLSIEMNEADEDEIDNFVRLMRVTSREESVTTICRANVMGFNGIPKSIDVAKAFRLIDMYSCELLIKVLFDICVELVTFPTPVVKVPEDIADWWKATVVAIDPLMGETPWPAHVHFLMFKEFCADAAFSCFTNETMAQIYCDHKKKLKQKSERFAETLVLLRSTTRLALTKGMAMWLLDVHIFPKIKKIKPGQTGSLEDPETTRQIIHYFEVF